MITMTLEERQRTASDTREHLVRRDTVRVSYEPGDLTHYEFVLTPLTHTIGIKGSETAYFTETHDTSRVVLSLLTCGRGAMTISIEQGSLLHPNYIQEKLGCSEWTSIVLGEFLSLMNEVPEKTLKSLRASCPHVFPVEEDI